MLITYKKLSLNQKSTYYYILCYFPIQFCVSLCIGCTGKRSGISVKGLRKFLSSEELCCLCHVNYSYILILEFISNVPKRTTATATKKLEKHADSSVVFIITSIDSDFGEKQSQARQRYLSCCKQRSTSLSVRAGKLYIKQTQLLNSFTIQGKESILNNKRKFTIFR